jgi:hypothetical protein
MNPSRLVDMVIDQPKLSVGGTPSIEPSLDTVGVHEQTGVHASLQDSGLRIKARCGPRCLHGQPGIAIKSVRLLVVMKTYTNEDGVEMYIPVRPAGAYGIPWPEEWLTVSYIRHDRTKLVQAMTIVLAIAAVMAVVARLVARRRTKACGWDDYLIVVAMVSAPLLRRLIAGILTKNPVGCQCRPHHRPCVRHSPCRIWKTRNAADDGRTIALLSSNPLRRIRRVTTDQYSQMVIVTQMQYLFVMLFVKASLLILYRRIFGVNDGFRIVINVTAMIIAIWFIAALVLTTISSRWFGIGVILEKYAVMSNGITSAITDLLILCLPLPMVWRLHARLQMKIKLLIFFSLGAL